MTCDLAAIFGQVRPPALRPFGGWALRAAFDLEERSGVRLVCPLFAAGDLRRAAGFLALAAWMVPTPKQSRLLDGVPPAEFARWMLVEDPGEIAEVLHGPCLDPQLLALIGNEPPARPETFNAPRG